MAPLSSCSASCRLPSRCSDTALAKALVPLPFAPPFALPFVPFPEPAFGLASSGLRFLGFMSTPLQSLALTLLERQRGEQFADRIGLVRHADILNQRPLALRAEEAGSTGLQLLFRPEIDNLSLNH